MKKINEEFVCIGCGKHVVQASKTCRNHCPYCFVSLHVDGEVPGDRASDCHGRMYPIDYQIKHGELKILFSCEKCGKQHRNKKAADDDIDGLLTYVKKRA